MPCLGPKVVEMLANVFAGVGADGVHLTSWHLTSIVASHIITQLKKVPLQYNYVSCCTRHTCSVDCWCGVLQPLPDQSRVCGCHVTWGPSYMGADVMSHGSQSHGYDVM